MADIKDVIEPEARSTGGWIKGKLGAIEANESVETLKEELAIDKLTKLRSRREIEDILDFITRKDSKAALLFIDIDHFKDVNDTYGHLEGDKVLQYLSLRLLSNISEQQGDRVGRFGGEEFVGLLNKVDDLKVAKERAEELRRAFEERPFVLENGRRLNITISVGVVIRRTGENAESGADLLRRADRALYLAKKSGRNNVKTEEDLRKVSK